jgi:preprotein translocase subunit SecG
MYTLLLTLLIIDSIVLLVAVLLQAGQGGGLASLGGGSSTDSFFGGRQAVTILTKASWISGGTFLALALVLAGMSSGSAVPRSVLEEGISAPVPVAPLPLDVGQPADPASTGGADAEGPASEVPSGG